MLEFLGGVGTVTGSKFCLEVDDQRLLVDCGLYQGLKALRLRNWDRLPVVPDRIGTVVLTHAHIDHTGYLPRLVAEGFAGQVLATRATAALARIMLPDSGHLQEEEAAYHNKRGTSKHAPALPLYTAEQGERAAARVEGLAYGVPAHPLPGVELDLRRAGHILGSASVAVTLGNGSARRRVVFSGDVGRYGAPILPDPAAVGEADYVLVESTYGDRRHDPDPIPAQLERAVTMALRRGGVLLVPAFAVGRTQELLYHLRALEETGRIPRLPTFVDSPMAVDATGIYCDHPEEYDEEARRIVLAGECPMHTADFHLVQTVEDSKRLNDLRGSAVIIAASGMATGGRILHHLRVRLSDPRTTVLLVGYQAPGTRGRLIQDGAKAVRIFGEEVAVRAHVEALHGLSAHADSEGLMRWLGTATRPPRRLFVVHGDPAPAAVLAERVRRELGWAVTVPGFRDRVALD